MIAVSRRFPMSKNPKPPSHPSPSSFGPGPWPGHFVWHDLITQDAAAAVRFYQALLGWEVKETKVGNATYRMILCGGVPMGGIEQRAHAPHWMPHLAVLDVDAASRKVKELGGSVRVPPTEIPGTGRFAIVVDPQGASLSLYQGRPGTFGHDPSLAVPGRACWNELYTSDDKAALRFYSGLAGWRDEPKDIGPMGTYHVQKLGEHQTGGIMKNPMPPGTPSCWVVYFFAPDLVAASKRVGKLGGRTMMENVPIEGVGAFSMATDPTGAMFALFQPLPGSC